MGTTMPTDRGYAVISRNDGTMTVKIATGIENGQPVVIYASHVRARPSASSQRSAGSVPPHINTRRRWWRCSLAVMPSLYEYRVRWRAEGCRRSVPLKGAETVRLDLHELARQAAPAGGIYSPHSA